MSALYDVIIIGSGAGGGTLARHLAPSGKSILLMERGGWLPRERQNWDVDEVFVKNRYVSQETWYDRHDQPFQPGLHYYVGGATKMYGAALYRLRREDFGEVRHYDGISPAWPISYDALEPYYTKAEQMYQVHGARGEDPTEPPSSAPYPFPAVSHEPRIQELHDDLARAGYRPFHTPCGIMLNEANMPFSACIRCADCDGFPCLVHAKSDAEVLGVRPALAYPNVTLVTSTQAVKLNTNAAGTAVTEVVARRGAATETYTGGIVVVSCGAANSAKLLLLSASAKHPNGLANGSDQVGRNYMFHNSAAVLAISRTPNPTQYQKTLGLNDFYFGMDGFEYPMGNIQMVGKSQGAMYKGEKPLEAGLAPMWTLDELARHAVDFWLSTEDLPMAGEPGHRARATAPSGSATPRTTRCRGSSSTTSSSPCSNTSGCIRPPDPAQPLHEERDRHRRGGAPGGHLSLRHAIPGRRCSTRTAKPTSWTISTSSTPASSRASAPSTRR